MQYTAPHYYKKFHCTGSDCPATCCAGWQIQIDPASLRKYRKMKGLLGNRLQNEIDWKEGCFRRYGGRCAFLNENNLCDLYLEGGGSRAFCRTCRTYPRHIEEFEGLREISLSLSCPVAAELIINSSEPVRFLHGENPDREENYDDFDFLLFTKLMDARSLIIRFLQNREHPFRLRALSVLRWLTICRSGLTGMLYLRRIHCLKDMTLPEYGTGSQTGLKKLRKGQTMRTYKGTQNRLCSPSWTIWKSSHRTGLLIFSKYERSFPQMDNPVFRSRIFPPFSLTQWRNSS